MAGMEIFGWSTFAIAMCYAWRNRTSQYAGEPQLKDFGPFIPWKTLIALYVIVLLGLAVNGTETADRLYIIGSQRWMFLLTGFSFALALAPPSLKGYRIFLIFASVIAIYAVFQSFTGIDLLRPGSERAVQRLDVRHEIQLWRSAGLFGSPMGYVYIAGMYSCLPLAVTMLAPGEARKLRWFSIFTFLLIAASLVTTYVRGGWFAMLISYALMAWMTSRKLFWSVIGAFIAGFVLLFTFMIQFRERLMSLFDSHYASNSDRMNLWKMNWRMVKDYPILGIGWGENEARACDPKFGLDCNASPKPFTGHAHNNFIQSLAGTGFLGFAAYMIFISFFLWLNWRLWKKIPADLIWARSLALACFGAQIFLHIGGLTECNFKAGATNHNFMIVLGLVASLSVLEKKGLLRKVYASVDLKTWPKK